MTDFVLAVSCSTLPYVGNAVLIGNYETAVYGEVVRLDCYTGYHLPTTGAITKSIECQHVGSSIIGQWSSSIENCVGMHT